MFKDVLNNIIETNKISENKNIQTKEEEKNKEKDKYIPFSNNEIPNICYSKKLYSLILEKDFNIISYKKLLEIPNDSYNETIEIYTVSYNNWIFEIKNINDDDIEDGIFAVYSIKNEITEEIIDEYLDLGCINTGENKLTRFLIQLECKSRKEYLQKVFGIYMNIPELLSEYGYNIDDSLYDMNKIQKDGAILKIETLPNDISIYFKIYESSNNNICSVITNDSRWNINSLNRTLSKKRAYYLKNYDGNIDYLISLIESFKEHMLGHIGYPCKNGSFFTDEDIYLYSRKLMEQVPFETRNTYILKREFYNLYDYFEYSEKSLMPNKINGRELYSILKFSFNDAFQWSKGDIALDLIFVFEYNTNIDKDNIILHIYGMKINNKTYEFEFLSPEKKLEYEKEENYYYVNEWDYAKLCVDDEFKGNEKEVIEKMNEYLIEAAKAFEIENCFGTDEKLTNY